MSKKKIASLSFGEDALDRDAGHISTSDINNFLAGFKKESDRGVVLALASIFDDLLERRLRDHFKQGSVAVRNGLFDLNGPFSTFSSKIDALYCLGDIGGTQRTDLHLIRKLRNHAAHSWDSFEFSEEVESKYITPIQNYLHIAERDEEGSEALLEARTKLLLTAAQLLISLTVKKSTIDRLVRSTRDA